MQIQKDIRFLIIIILLLAVLSVFFLVNNTKRNKTTFDWVSHTYKVLEATEEASGLVTNIESELRGYLVSGNEAFLNEIQEKQDQLKYSIGEIEKLTVDNPAQQINADRLKNLISQKFAFHKEVLGKYQGSKEEAIALVSGNRGKLIADSIKQLTTKMESGERVLLESRINQNRNAARDQLVFALIFLLSTFLVLVIALFLINSQVAKRKAAQLESLANEEKYFALIRNTALTIYSSDLYGYFTYASEQCFDLTGYTSKELVGQRFSILIRKDWVDRVEHFYVEQLQNRNTESQLNFPIVTKDGREKWVEQNTIMMYQDEKVVGFQSFVKDITEKKRNDDLLKKAEEKLAQQREENESRLQAILDNIPMAVYIKDLDGHFIMINKQFRRTFGLEDEKVLGRKAHELVNNERDAKFYADTDHQVISTLRPVETEQVVVTRDGERNMLVTKFPLFDKNNKLFAISGVDKDITDMVRYREQLIHARRKAESAEKLQEEFLANMSHEIRTPMNGIVGMANLLADTGLDEEQREFVSYIRYSSDILLALINDILDLSKIKAGRMTLENTDFNLYKAIDSVFVPMKIKANEKALKIEKTLDPSLPSFVKGDRFKLTQILNNLLSNAVKFTDEGLISLLVKPVSRQEDSTEIEFILNDTGIGIASDQLESIFESFVQVGDDMVKRAGGTGLGLAITKKLVELQGGHLVVASERGKGTSFRFKLRFRNSLEADEKLIGAENGGEARGLKGKKILLVEDNLVNQKVTFHMLKKAGLEVSIANDGKEAVELFEKGGKFDLILMDLQMPEMDGFQVTTYLRNKLKIDTPVIAMTASVLRNEKLKCFEVGMNGYLPKPFAPEELFSNLNHFLGTGDYQVAEKQVMPSFKNYDLAFIYELEDDAYTAEVLEIFLNTTPATLSALKKCSLSENWDEVSRAAHKLKSSVGLLQMNTILSDLLMVEEYATKKHNLNEIPVLIKHISSQYELIRPMLEAELADTRKKIIQH